VRSELPAIAKTAARLRASIEIAWTRCARRHRYGIGTDLRDQATAVQRCTLRAWRDRNHQLQRVRELVIAIDDLKLTVQLAKDVCAFASFDEFEAIARLVDDVGRQSGGWLKRLHSQSQNAQGALPLEQRAQILSSRAASPSGATP
jgi:hypothetical protein